MEMNSRSVNICSTCLSMLGCPSRYTVGGTSCWAKTCFPVPLRVESSELEEVLEMKVRESTKEDDERLPVLLAVPSSYRVDLISLVFSREVAR